MAALADDKQVVFIDSDVSDIQDLVAGLAPGVQAFVLDPSSDGVQQIANILAANDLTDLSSISIVGHGAAGEIQLGSTLLDEGDLSNESAGLAQIGAALAPGGDLQLYACDVASGAAGQQFIADLSQYAGGAAIAASSNLVGSSAEGGSWTLDADVGAPKVASPFTAAATSAYSGELSITSNQIVFAVSNLDGIASGSRVEQFGVSGSSPSGLTDIVDGTQTSDPILNDTTGIAVDTALQEYFVASYNQSSYTLTIQEGSTAGGGLSTFYTDPLPFLGSNNAPGGGPINGTAVLLGGMAIDGQNGELYFAQDAENYQSGDYVFADTGIYEVSVKGGTPTLLTPTNGTVFNPNDIALDAPANLLFFTDSIEAADGFDAVDNLDAVNLTTGAVTVVKSFFNSADTTDLLEGLAVNGSNIYLTTRSFDSTSPTFGANSANNQILSIPFTVSGSGSTATASVGAATTLYSGSGAFQPTDIVVDAAHGIFYTTGETLFTPPGQNQGDVAGIFEGSLTGGSTLTQVLSMTDVTGAVTSTSSPAFDTVSPQLVLLTPPVIVAGATVNATSGGGAVTVDSGITVADADGQNLAGATVSGALTSDTLSFNSGNTRTFGDGDQISSSFSGGILTLSGNATAADYQTALDSVMFSTTSTDTTARTLDWTVSDGVVTSATASSTVNVAAPANHAPSGTNATVTTLEDMPYVFGAGDFGFNDVDGNSLLAVEITTLPGAGALTDNGVAVTASQFVPVADIAGGKLVFTPGANGNGDGYASFTFQVQDNGGTANGGVNTDPSPNTFTFNVTPVNDAPVNSVPGAQTVDEDAALVFSSGTGNAISISDPDAGTGMETVTLSVTQGTLTLGTLNAITIAGGANGSSSVEFNGTLADVNAALSGLTYQGIANFHGTDTLTIDTNDNGNSGAGGALSDQNSVSINVLSVNHAPSGTNATVTTLEDMPYVFGAGDFGFNDVDGNSLLAVEITTLPGAGALTDNGVAVTASQFVPVADIAGGKLVFTPGANGNGDGYASFTFQVQDNGGTANGGVNTDPSPNTFTFNVTPVNDAPVNSVPGAQTVDEDAALVFSSGTGNAISISDPDAGTGMETVTLSVTQGTLTLGTLNAITIAGGANGSSSVEFNGTLADVNAALSGLTYQGIANFHGTDTLTIDTNDNGNSGAGGALSDQNSVSINVLSVNHAPSGADATVTALGAAPYIFGVANFGFSDIDGNSFQAVKIDTTPGTGSLTDDGAAVMPGQSVSVTDISSGDLVFTPAPNGSTSFTFQVQDNGGTANGGADIDPSPNTLSFNVIGPSVTMSEFETYQSLIDAGPVGYQVAVTDTAANVGSFSALATLTADVGRISTINVTDMTPVVVGVGRFGPYQAALDKVADGFTFLGQASAISGDLNGIQDDLGNINSITALNGTVTASVATFIRDQRALDAIGSFAISDTAADIVNGLGSLETDASNIVSITASDHMPVTVGVGKFGPYQAALDKVADGFTFLGQASAISGDLNGIQDDLGNINSITALNGTVTASVATFIRDQRALDAIGSFAISDTAADIVNGLGSLETDASNVVSITASDHMPVTVGVGKFVPDKAALDKVAGGFTILGESPTISANFDSLTADAANINSLSFADASPALNLTQTQATNDASLIAKITGAYVENVSNGGATTTTAHGDNLTVTAVAGGNDSITANGTSEAFVFKPSFGQDSISNFNLSDAGETITLPNAEFADFVAVMNDAHQAGNDTIITSANTPNDALTLNNVVATSLRSSEFKFA